MSINAIRALILLANVLLLGLIGWVCHHTFIVVDKDRYFVRPPELTKFSVPEIAVDESQQKKDLYKALTRVLDRPPPPPPAPVAPEPIKPTLPDPRQIQVVMIQASARQDRSSALLNAPLANPKEPKFFCPGTDFGTPGLGFEAYAGCKIKTITPDEVIVTDQKGQEVKLPGPRPKEGG